jgi:endonuclease YncB( thermonuclease family)
MLGVVLATVALAGSAAAAPVYRVARVIDGDTIELGNGHRVRLVQIDTPEVYGGDECYGPAASAIAKRLLPAGTPVLLQLEPASDPIDRYGRLLRYVVRAHDGLNINLQLVEVGAAVPWFYEGDYGRFAPRLRRLVAQARAKRLGLWGACPKTRYDPTHAVTTAR